MTSRTGRYPEIQRAHSTIYLYMFLVQVAEQSVATEQGAVVVQVHTEEWSNDDDVNGKSRLGEPPRQLHNPLRSALDVEARTRETGLAGLVRLAALGAHEVALGLELP